MLHLFRNIGSITVEKVKHLTYGMTRMVDGLARAVAAKCRVIGARQFFFKLKEENPDVVGEFREFLPFSLSTWSALIAWSYWKHPHLLVFPNFPPTL